MTNILNSDLTKLVRIRKLFGTINYDIYFELWSDPAGEDKKTLLNYELWQIFWTMTWPSWCDIKNKFEDETIDNDDSVWPSFLGTRMTQPSWSLFCLYNYRQRFPISTGSLSLTLGNWGENTRTAGQQIPPSTQVSNAQHTQISKYQRTWKAVQYP